jgi:hypothetical protein
MYFGYWWRNSREELGMRENEYGRGIGPEMSPEYAATWLKAQGDTYLIWLALLHHLIGSLLQPSREHGVLAVDKLLLLPTRHFDLLCVGHNDIVTTVN